ncbi:hypothetical protein FH972_020880 [Carpinus fangiana]|uniref:Uncharacterized protein n=1 Tax=Carpinus fangiana TaxID=176857 RepID=A0A5N6RUK3_9ROSI|nr:hypothetical protein FH972_020880 [Carpinus fangiana]
MTTSLGDSFNISIDEASGVQKAVQEVVESSGASAINGETLSESATLGSGWPIFRVPAHVREVDDRAYSPRIVSIGPYHHDEEALRPFEDHKKRFLSRLKKRMGPECQERRLEKAMQEMEEKTRECYSEDFGGIERDDFVQMMLLDGCFIVELLRLYTPPMKTSQLQGRQVVKEKEPIIETRWMLPNIGRDLLMLENQLPMFVLQEIYDITTLKREGATPPLALKVLALRFFQPLRPGKDKLEEHVLNTIEKQKHPHLLALFQSTFHNPQGNPNASVQTPNSSRPKSDNQSKSVEECVGNTNRQHPHLLARFQSTFTKLKSLLPKSDNQSMREKIPGGKGLKDDMLDTNQQHRHEHDDPLAVSQSTSMNAESSLPGKGWVHNATTLRYSGVRFKKKSGNFLDIEYKFTVLTIPTLYIDDGTSTLLRNLIAYEQSNRSANPPYFSCLAVFLDCLVDTVDDINILRRAGIIKQAKGGDQEVVDLFNSLTKELEIDMDDCYLKKHIDAVNSHHKTHETMVRFSRVLYKLNFTRFIIAYISTLITLISIWSAFHVCNCKDGDQKGGRNGRRS